MVLNIIATPLLLHSFPRVYEQEFVTITTSLKANYGPTW